MDTTKIIKGVVNSGRYTVTAPIVKEDYGLYLQIEGVELPSTYEVDFSNSEHSGTSVTMIGNSDGVLIPHQFIDTGKDIFAFLYHVGANYGRTVYKFRIPNKVRPDRTNEQPTPEEQSVIDQAISALNTAVAQTAQDVIDADASAQSASADADRAEEAKTDAQNFATQAEQARDDAQTYANNASASATASAQSASEAQTASTNAETYALNSGNKAVESAQSASASANSASQAQGFAQSASASAQSASGYANNAQTSANTASNKASEASTSAQTASNKASEASQSASQALSYKTDAESAKTASQTAQGLAESARDLAQGYAEDAQGYANDAQASAEGISASASQIAQNTANILKAFPTDTASGAIASFSDGADDLPLKSLVVDINPVQDLHGYDSPWGAGGGKNLFDDSQPLLAGILNADGTSSGKSSASNKHTYKIPIKAGATYTYSVSVTRTSNTVGCVYDENNAVIDNFMLARNTTTISFTAPENAVSVSLSIYNVAGQLVQFEEGSTATEWSPYENICPISGWEGMQLNVNGTVIPISWQSEAGTVYGGSLDVLSGKLTVYPYYASYNGETLTGEWISDRDVYASGTTPTIGAQVVNIGAEGTEIQLEPHEIASLLGVNNIFADTGDSTAEYRADTKLYIERLTAPDSADMIADANITSGQYFMVGNTLYKATANIANGGQIIVGTNATRVSLAQALNEINA